MAVLKFYLLGSPRLEHDQPIKLPRQKSQALAIYLAVTAREQPREKIAALLWPDASDAQARQALRTALWDIRRATSEEHLITDTETIALNSAASIWIDVNELQALAQDPLRENAPGLRLAPFLDGFNLKDAPDFDDWVSFERDRLQQLALKTLRARADAYEMRGEYQHAITAAQQLLELDPAHEETHRQLMRLQYASGNRAAAISQYETARAALDRELGVEPMDETRLLYQQILDQAKMLSAAPAKKSAPRQNAEPFIPFVGREREREKLQRCWDTARGGRIQFAFIEGEAGVGKTRLVEQKLSDWTRASATNVPLILRGTAHQLENNQPYHLVIDILREYFGSDRIDDPQTLASLSDVWLSEITRLIPELREMRPHLPSALRLQTLQARSGLAEAAQERNRLFQAVSQFLSALAERQPLILFFDDVQWADPSTLALIAFLANALLRARVLILCAYRGAETTRDLDSLIHTASRAGLETRIGLQRLQADQVRALAGALSQCDCEPFANWLYRESEGNPFFIRELMAWLVANGLAKFNGAGWDMDLDHLASALPTIVLPSSIHDLVRARLQNLSGLARQLLDVAAIIGRDFDFATLARASGKEEDSALDALDELLRAQVVRQTAQSSSPYEFSHIKIHTVVLSDMSLARQQILHRRVGEALELTQRERIAELSSALALHFRTAGEWAKAARYARAAGDRARAVYAPQEAIEFYTAALSALSHLDDREAAARAHMGVGMAQVMLGHPDQSFVSFAHALSIWEQLDNRARAAAVRFEMGLSHIFRGEYRQALELAQSGLRELETQANPDKVILARGHALWAIALSNFGGDLNEAKNHLRQAAELYSQTDDYAGQCQAQIELGNVAAQEGALAEAVACYERATQLAERGNEVMFGAMAYNNAAYHSLLLGNLGIAHTLVQRGLEIAESRNITPMLAYLYSTRAEILIAEQNWDQAKEFLLKGMGIADQLNSPERRAGYWANLAEVAYGRGEYETAFLQLTNAVQIAEEISARYASARYHLRLAEMLQAQNKPAAAQPHLWRGKQIAQEGNYQRLLAQAQRIVIGE